MQNLEKLEFKSLFKIILITHSAKATTRAERVIYLSDSKIIAEIELKKCERKNLPGREYKMNRCFESLGGIGFGEVII